MYRTRLLKELATNEKGGDTYHEDASDVHRGRSLGRV